MMLKRSLARTNKDRLCEQNEPQSYPVVGRSRYRGGKTKTLQIYKAGDYFEKNLKIIPKIA